MILFQQHISLLEYRIIEVLWKHLCSINKNKGTEELLKDLFPRVFMINVENDGNVDMHIHSSILKYSFYHIA